MVNGNRRCVFACGAFFSLALCSQCFGQGDVTKPAFEVASVKPFTPDPNIPITQRRMVAAMSRSVTDSGLDLRDITLAELVAYAYRVKLPAVTGPGWILTDKFEIQAKYSEGLSKDRAPEVMQALLIERFGLVSRVETKRNRVYALIAAASGAKLRPPSAGAPSYGSMTSAKCGGYLCRNVSMKQLADRLSEASTATRTGIDRRIIDATGLTGRFDFDLKFSWQAILPGMQPLDDSCQGGGSIFTALKTVGLNLEPRQVDEGAVVIQSAKRTPTQN